MINIKHIASEIGIDTKTLLQLFELFIDQTAVDLQKIRYGNQVNVEIKVSDNIENTMIAPLLLMPFVENAFKHGSIINNNIISIF